MTTNEQVQAAALKPEQRHKTIWLQPWCDGCEKHCWGVGEGRMWCQDNVWDDCEECGRKPEKYVLATRPTPAALDPATVEACAREAEWEGYGETGRVIAKRIRALADA